MDSHTTRKNESGFSVYVRLLKFIKPDTHYLIIGFIGFAVYAACDSAFAWWMKELVDNIEAQNMDKRWFLAGFIIMIFLVRGLGGITGAYCTEYVARKVVNKIRGNLFAHILELPCQYYERFTSGSILSKLIYNVENIAAASINSLRIVVRGGLTVIGLIGYMFYINWQLTTLFLIVTPLMAVIILVVTKRFRNISHQIQNAMGNVGERAGEVMRGYQVVKVFAGMDHENRKFREIINNDFSQRIRLVITNDVSATIVQLLFSLALAALIIIAMQPSILLNMSSGEFVSFVTAAGFISRPVLQLTQVNSTIQQGVAAAQSVFDVLDIPPEQDFGKIKLENCRGELTFKDVSFRYNDEQEWILEDINLTIMPGETCALVGRSGSGKSTLAGLVARFYDVQSGEVTLDGVSLTELSLKNLRENVALVNQNISLFSGTIAENIAYGSMSRYSREDIRTAAEHAQVLEFADKLPNGLDTQIGESGMLQSGGQRQRIAIARAFLKDAPILILDEATSALDNQSELLIQKALHNLMQDRTSLIIAHRLSTIENADKILVLKSGRIIESGTHKELMDKDGAYKKMHRKKLF
jgi:subfamily B ATP-binding cassette protein MsbA